MSIIIMIFFDLGLSVSTLYSHQLEGRWTLAHYFVTTHPWCQIGRWKSCDDVGLSDISSDFGIPGWLASWHQCTSRLLYYTYTYLTARNWSGRRTIFRPSHGRSWVRCLQGLRPWLQWTARWGWGVSCSGLGFDGSLPNLVGLGKVVRNVFSTVVNWHICLENLVSHHFVSLSGPRCLSQQRRASVLLGARLTDSGVREKNRKNLDSKNDIAKLSTGFWVVSLGRISTRHWTRFIFTQSWRKLINDTDVPTF